MDAKDARRFAEISLERMGKEGVFTIVCRDREEMVAIVAELERLGATAVPDAHRYEVVVIAPIDATNEAAILNRRNRLRGRGKDGKPDTARLSTQDIDLL